MNTEIRVHNTQWSTYQQEMPRGALRFVADSDCVYSESIGVLAALLAAVAESAVKARLR